MCPLAPAPALALPVLGLKGKFRWPKSQLAVWERAESEFELFLRSIYCLLDLEIANAAFSGAETQFPPIFPESNINVNVSFSLFSLIVN